MRTAAFLLLLLLSPGFSACNGSDRRAVEPPQVAPEPVSPRGPVALPFSFTWKSAPGPESPVYRVRVTDAAERVLFEQDVRKSECQPSAELAAMMADHAAYFWSVGVLTAGSTVVSRSAAVEFSLK